MTELTQSELKMIYMQIVLAAVVGGFYALVAVESTYDLNINPGTSYKNEMNLDTSGGTWITNIINIPPTLVELTQVILLFISPILLFDVYIGARALKDLISQWV